MFMAASEIDCKSTVNHCSYLKCYMRSYSVSQEPTAVRRLGRSTSAQISVCVSQTLVNMGFTWQVYSSCQAALRSCAKGAYKFRSFLVTETVSAQHDTKTLQRPTTYRILYKFPPLCWIITSQENLSGKQEVIFKKEIMQLFRLDLCHMVFNT